MLDSSEILTERQDAVLLVTLNRPDRLNAFTRSMRKRYQLILDQADHDPGVRAIVLTGAGSAFCAGADLAESHADADEVGIVNGAPATRDSSAGRPPHTPLVAAINGTAAGAGLAAALSATVRFAAEDAMITTAFCQRGLLAEEGVAWLLPTLTGIDTALDVLMEAKALSGKHACTIGLVDRALPREQVLPAAVTCAQALARTGATDHE